MRWPSLRLLEPWRSRLLWLSLGLNLFGVALLAAPLVVPRAWLPHRPGPPGFDTVIDRMARNLPGPDAAGFRAAMGRERAGFDSDRARIDAARDMVGERIVHEPFDAAGVRARLQAMQDRLRESSQRFDDSLVAALATMSPEARARLVASMPGRRR